jgi:hypothetical protein
MFGRHDPAALRNDGGEGSLRITGWDVDPDEDLRLDIGTPGRPVAGRPPRIRVRLTCPATNTETCFRVDPRTPLSNVRGSHTVEDATVLAVPERPETRQPQPHQEEGGAGLPTCVLEPGESIVRTYELIATREFDGRLPTGAYRFEPDVRAETGCPGFTLWVNR